MKTIKATLTEPLLGTASADPNIYGGFIAKKHPGGAQAAQDEIDALPDAVEIIEKTTTVFHRTPEGGPSLWDYQIKGFFKDACGMLRRVKGTESAKRKAYKKEIDGLIFVTPRRIPLIIPEGGEIGFLERPLRAQTAQGERIALARSETVPAGTRLTADIQLLDDSLEGVMREWLEYGKLRGLGQWRNASYGRFTYEETR